nr:dermokine isoform X2 [Oryctolagus cuniculus]
MKLQGSLACLLLALCLGSGEAGPLLNGGENTGASAAEAIGQRLGDAVSHGIGEAVGRGAGEAAGSGTREVLGQGGGEAAGSGTREAGDTVNYRLGEAVHDLGNSGGEAGRQAETIVRQGIDAVHSSGSWGSSGGHGILDSQGSNPGGPGTPWGQRYPGASEGSFGTYSPGGSSGQGGNGAPFGSGTDAQGAVAQPGYGSVRGSNPNTGCTNAPPSGSGGSSSNPGGGSSHGGGSGGSGGSSSHGGGSGGSGGSSSHGGSSGGSGGSSSHGGGSGGSSSHGGGSGGSGSSSSHGSSGSSSSGPGGGRPLETSRDVDQSFSVSKGTNSGPSSSSSGGSGGGHRPECDNPGNDARVSGGSGSQESRESSHLLGGSQSSHQGQGSDGDSSGKGDVVNGLSGVNSQTAPELFNFDTFWKNFKSKLGFINWDAINKGQLPAPSTRALLYFRRLWEDFKRNTPFLNWKEIIEGADASSLQKRAGGADQFPQPGAGRQERPAVTSKNYSYNQQAHPTAYGIQYTVKTPGKGGVTPSSSASRVQPGLLQWVKFW